MSMTRAEPTWQLRRAIEDALPEAFSDEACALLALDIGAAVAEHLLDQLDEVGHAAHSCHCSRCGEGCLEEHRGSCSCPIADVADLIRVRPE